MRHAPRTFTSREGTPGAELSLAVEVPSRSGEAITRWVKVTAFGVLASRTADSVRKGDRVTVIADDLTAGTAGDESARNADSLERSRSVHDVHSCQ